MEKLQIQNMGLPRFPIIFCTKHCVYFSDNRALPQVLTCGKRIVIGKPWKICECLYWKLYFCSMKKSESQLISLISIAGLCGLFIADYFKGGLSGLQGFFLGFFICFIGYLVFSVVFLPKKTKSYQPQEDDRIIKCICLIKLKKY